MRAVLMMVTNILGEQSLQLAFIRARYFTFILKAFSAEPWLVQTKNYRAPMSSELPATIQIDIQPELYIVEVPTEEWPISLRNTPSKYLPLLAPIFTCRR